MEKKGVVKNLFDLSFSEFITPKVIKFLYILCMIGIFIAAIMIIINGFNISTGIGVISLLIIAPLYIVIGLFAVRVWLELVLIFFKIHDKIDKIKKED